MTEIADLYKERGRLKIRRDSEIEMIRRDYDPKIEAISLQIDRENQKGIKKRIKANTGKFFR